MGLDGEIQSPVVEVIYAQEQVIDFDEIVPQEKEFIAEDEIPEQDVSEDEIKELEDKVQKVTDKFVKEIDKAVDEKSKEILTV